MASERAIERVKELMKTQESGGLNPEEVRDTCVVGAAIMVSKKMILEGLRDMFFKNRAREIRILNNSYGFIKITYHEQTPTDYIATVYAIGLSFDETFMCSSKQTEAETLLNTAIQKILTNEAIFDGTEHHEIIHLAIEIKHSYIPVSDQIQMTFECHVFKNYKK